MMKLLTNEMMATRGGFVVFEIYCHVILKAETKGRHHPPYCEEFDRIYFPLERVKDCLSAVYKDVKKRKKISIFDVVILDLCRVFVLVLYFSSEKFCFA